MSTESQNKEASTSNPPASVVWFEIPADNMERAKSFYQNLFGWNVSPIPNMADYWHVDTGGADQSPDAGLMKRKHPGQGITNYVLVKSVSAAVVEVEKLGGKVCVPKTAVPSMGHFAICQDTENNTFGVWEMDQSAK